jgi:uncharacterized protein
MRWQGRRQSENIEDRRGAGPAVMAGGGLGIVGVIIVIIYVLMGGDPNALKSLPGPGGGQAQSQQSGPVQASPQEEESAQFVSVVLAETEDVWNKIFADQLGMRYEEPKLQLFRGSTATACGHASSGVGPFYCPGDKKVYIDLSFYDQLKRQLNSPGDFAQAYVVAHEVGHHIQNLLGTTRKLDAMRGRVSQEEYNQMSVRLELQADFLAGVWAFHAHRNANILEQGDLEEALNAAHNIGDDTLQKRSGGYINPESFTHGTSAQRMRWFKLGFQSGDIRKGEAAFQIPYEQL